MSLPRLIYPVGDVNHRRYVGWHPDGGWDRCWSAMADGQELARFGAYTEARMFLLRRKDKHHG